MTGTGDRVGCERISPGDGRPCGAVVVSVYVIKSLFHLVVPVLRLDRALAIRREEHDDDVPKL